MPGLMVTVLRTKGYILIWFYVVEMYLKKKNKRLLSNSLVLICQHPTCKPTRSNMASEQMSYKKKKVLEYKIRMILIRK